MNMKRIYNALLRLYPTAHRSLFSAEMSRVFEEAADDRRRRGRTAFFRFVLAELIGVLKGAAVQWTVTLTHPPQATSLAPADKITQAQKHLDFILTHMDTAIATHQFPKARFLAEAERRAREKLRILQQNRDPKQ